MFPKRGIPDAEVVLITPMFAQALSLACTITAPHKLTLLHVMGVPPKSVPRTFQTNNNNSTANNILCFPKNALDSSSFVYDFVLRPSVPSSCSGHGRGRRSGRAFFSHLLLKADINSQIIKWKQQIRIRHQDLSGESSLREPVHFRHDVMAGKSVPAGPPT